VTNSFHCHFLKIIASLSENIFIVVVQEHVHYFHFSIVSTSYRLKTSFILLKTAYSKLLTYYIEQSSPKNCRVNCSTFSACIIPKILTISWNSSQALYLVYRVLQESQTCEKEMVNYCRNYSAMIVLRHCEFNIIWTQFSACENAEFSSNIQCSPPERAN